MGCTNRKAATALALVACGFSPALKAQDVVKVAGEHNKTLMEDQDVRVIQNTLAPGEKDALHTHPHGWYYVVKPGKMKVVFKDGTEAIWDAKQGEGGWIKARAAHTSENIGDTTLVYVLVEVKSAEKRDPLKAPKARSEKKQR
jgi:oxalate decarboxylase/phosphoglucose isomerase-like protein (cupin superfamily)